MGATVILPADAPREQWEATRMTGLGGSDVAAACGLSPYKTPFQLWLEKTGRVLPEFDDASAERMRWGTRLEPLLLREFDERHDEVILTGGEGTYADDDAPWQLANVDGLTWTSEQRLDGIVEVKTANHRQADYWADDGVPVQYVAQCQWYMHILGAPRAHVVALIDTSTYVERVLERDDELIADLVEHAAEFWRCVLADERPPVDATDGTRRALARMHAEPGKVVDLDPLWREAIDRRAKIDDQLADLQAERDQIDNELRVAMGDAEQATIGDEVVATHRAPRKPTRSVPADVLDELAEEFPDVYADVVVEKPAPRRLAYKKGARK